FRSGRAADCFGDCVRGFKRRNDSFCPCEEFGGVESLRIGAWHILGAAVVVQPGVLGSNRGVVEAGRDGMCQRDLSVLILKQIAVAAVQNTRSRTGEAGSVFTQS